MMTTTMMIMTTKVKIMAADEEATVQSMSPDVKNQIQNSPRMWKGKDILINLMYVCPCIICEIEERYPLDATIYLLL